MIDIQGYENEYAITNDGKVWSYKSNRFLKQRLLNGYFYVGLCKNGKQKNFFIHRLVAQNFLNKEDFKYMPYEDIKNINLDLLEVNHKDENTLNNNVENLEWCTSKYNANYGSRNNKIKELNKNKILTQEQKENLSNKLKEKFSDINNHPRFNKKQSLEECYKKSLTDLKRKYKNKDSFKVGQYSTDGNLIEIYDSPYFAKHISKHITECIDGKRKTAGGFIWKWI